MLVEFLTLTTFSFYKPNSWDITSNSLDEINHVDYRELVMDAKNIERSIVNEGVATSTTSCPFVDALAILKSKLDSFLSLRNGWDGREAKPVNPLSAENVKAIAEHQWDWNFKLWQIAPGVNGDIFINYKGRNILAGLVIGPTTFSYFIEGEKLQGESNLPFDSIKVSTLMNTIVNA